MKKCVAFALSIMLISCSLTKSKSHTKEIDAEAVTGTFYVAPYKSDCVGLAPMKCLLVKTNTDDIWTNFYAPIKGFVHESGYEYIIKVLETPNTGAPADASSINYTLKEVVEKKLFTQANTNLYDIWGIVGVNGIKPLESNCEQSLEINLAKNTVMGKAGCNNFRGEVEVKKGSNAISFKNILSTRRTCPNQLLEDNYLAALNAVDAFFHYNQNLLLLSKGEVVIKARRMD